MKIAIKILDKELYSDVRSFESATPGSAAIDLKLGDNLIIGPNKQCLVGAGIAVWIRDPGVCGIVLPRSGLGHKEGLVLGNLAGLIDSDFQNEIMLSLWNRSGQPREYRRGCRIAQMMFLPVIKPTFYFVDKFSEQNDRGSFGSTGE